jgi:hypothetical protein
MSESAQIAVILIGLAVLTLVLVSLRHTGPQPAPDDVPYATFHRDGSPRVLLTDCEGPCEGATAHEDDGTGTATCVTCGTPRTGLVPDQA